MRPLIYLSICYFGLSCALEKFPDEANFLTPIACFTQNRTSCSIADCEVEFDGTCSENSETFSWDYGDGASGSGATTTHTYTTPGAYTILLVVTNSSGTLDSTMKSISVEESVTSLSPTACFQIDSLTCGGYAPTELFLTNCSENATSFSWDFDDGSGSQEEAPDPHSYSTGGSYTIRLTAMDDMGNQDDTTLRVSIKNLQTEERKFIEQGVEALYNGIVQKANGNYVLMGIEDPGIIGKMDAIWMEFSQDGTQVGNRKYFGGAENDAYSNIRPTSDGGFIFCGETWSKGEGAPARSNYWVVKMDEDGDVTWDGAFGGTGQEQARDVIELSNGNFAVLGFSDSNNGNGGNDFWLVILNADGQSINDAYYGGAENDLGYQLTESSSGDLILSGPSYSFGNGSQAWILIVDKNTLVQKNQLIYGESDRNDIYRILPTSDGGYVFYGNYGGSSGEQRDLWAFKTSSSLAVDWEFNSYQTPNTYDVLFRMIELEDGSFLAAGETGGLLDENTRRNGIILRIDQFGNYQFGSEKLFGGPMEDVIMGMIQTDDCGFLLSGKSTSTESTAEDAWVIKTDRNLNVQ